MTITISKDLIKQKVIKDIKIDIEFITNIDAIDVNETEITVVTLPMYDNVVWTVKLSLKDVCKLIANADKTINKQSKS